MSSTPLDSPVVQLNEAMSQLQRDVADLKRIVELLVAASIRAYPVDIPEAKEIIATWK